MRPGGGVGPGSMAERQPTCDRAFGQTGAAAEGPLAGAAENLARAGIGFARARPADGGARHLPGRVDLLLFPCGPATGAVCVGRPDETRLGQGGVAEGRVLADPETDFWLVSSRAPWTGARRDSFIPLGDGRKLTVC